MTKHKTLRIACLHGYCQNAEIFRLKSGGLRKSLERKVGAIRGSSSSSKATKDFPMAELVYVDAPFVLEERLGAAHSAAGQPLSESDKFMTVFRPVQIEASARSRDDRTKRSWWAAEEDGKKYNGWHQSLDYLRDAFRKKGAIVASLICSLRNDRKQKYAEFASVRFAIMVSGFPARATTLQWLYDAPISVPSIHVWGEEDNMVPGFASKALFDKFDEIKRCQHVHKKGHMVPSDSESRRIISSFVLQFSDEVNRKYEERLRAAL